MFITTSNNFTYFSGYNIARLAGYIITQASNATIKILQRAFHASVGSQIQTFQLGLRLEFI